MASYWEDAAQFNPVSMVLTVEGDGSIPRWYGTAWAGDAAAPIRRFAQDRALVLRRKLRVGPYGYHGRASVRSWPQPFAGNLRSRLASHHCLRQMLPALVAYVRAYMFL